jgi:hypothetical protein
MYGPDAILDWLTQHVQGVRRSRLKTLSSVVSAAMRIKGVGVLALAYPFLSAFGAAAETLQVDRQLKANTVNERVMNLARMGNYFLQLAHCTLDFALQSLHALPT